MPRPSRRLEAIRLHRSGTDAPHTRIVLADEIDLVYQEHLDTAFEAVVTAAPADVTVDLTEVTFLGSVGLNFLVQLHLRVTRAGHRCTVLNPAPIVRRALASTGLDGLLTIVSDDPA
jgi:anti-sigma B factor antagonist